MKYFVYIATENESGCPKYDSLGDAIYKYKVTPMTKFGDCVFLGIEDGTNICFDILHKFFEDSILINDYLNHPEYMSVLNDIENELDIRYQFTVNILGGVLIDYNTSYLSYNDKGMKVDEKWNELHLSTCKGTSMDLVGWVKPSRDTKDRYGWNYPVTASYVSMMNVTAYDNNGCRHEIDMDPRAYLNLLGKRVS